MLAASRPRSVASFDGVRGIAVLVFLLHNLSLVDARATLAEKLWTEVVEFGWAGVELGFALTGFLITTVVLDDRDKSGFLRTFYVRRLLRVVPLYYAILLVYVLVAPLIEPALRMGWLELLGYATFLSNVSIPLLGERPGLGPTWAVAIVVQFYVVWPLLAGRARPRTLATVCVALVVIAFLSRVGISVLRVDKVWTHVATVARMDCLALGALVALAMRSESWRPRLARATRPALVGSAAVLLAIYALTKGMAWSNPLVSTVGYSAFAVGSAALVAMAARPEPPRWLAHPGLAFVGHASYGLFLVHSPLQHIVTWTLGSRLTDAMTARPILTDAAMIASLAVASLLAALVAGAAIERPLQRRR